MKSQSLSLLFTFVLFNPFSLANGDCERAVNATDRIQWAMALLDLDYLPAYQVRAIWEAHEVGMGELGKEGQTLASFDNYTNRQMRQKLSILRDGGFDREQRRVLYEAGVVGSGLLGIFGRKKVDVVRRLPGGAYRNERTGEIMAQWEVERRARHQSRPGGSYLDRATGQAVSAQTVRDRARYERRPDGTTVDRQIGRSEAPIEILEQ